MLGSAGPASVGVEVRSHGFVLRHIAVRQRDVVFSLLSEFHNNSFFYRVGLSMRGFLDFLYLIKKDLEIKLHKE